MAHGPHCYVACRILLDPGIESMSPALAGRFSSTVPPGKSPNHLFLIISLVTIPGNIIYYSLIAGEGNGNPLHYSCLEKNPMDGGSWLQSVGSQRVRHDSATSLSLSPITVKPANWNKSTHISVARYDDQVQYWISDLTAGI